MKNLKIIYLKDLNWDEIKNFHNIHELVITENNYYKLKNKTLSDISDHNYEDFNNLCCIISNEDTASPVLYKDKIEVLEQVTSDTLLYKKKKRKISYGRYVAKKTDGKIVLVDVNLCDNQLCSEYVFEYVDLETGNIYNNREIIVAYPLKNLDREDVIKSRFYNQNKSIIFELLDEHEKNLKKRKEEKNKVLKRFLKEFKKND